MPGIPHLKAAPNASPIFPSEAFSPVDSSLTLPEAEVITSGSVSLSIVLAEPIIFLRGYSPSEYLDRPPSLLRGTLVVRVQKAVKIKSITLSFKGAARTEWPDGIPPKKTEFFELKELHNHTWPFFNASFPMSDFSSGANMIRLSKEGSHRRNLSVDKIDHDPHANNSSTSLNTDGLRAERGSSSTRSRSNTARSDSPDTKGVKGLAGRLRRAASPSPSFPKEQILHSLNLGPRRSFSKDEPVDNDTQSKGYRTFEAGEYFYNFELPLPQSLPETIESNFGSVKYSLEASIEKPGAFRSKVSGTKEVVVVRAPADGNIEGNEPIAISKQWEDQLYYDIIISGKAFPIGTPIPIAFKLTPLAKIEVHRIRVYITENSEYYCRNKRVHRIEPNKKFLIGEKVSSEGLSGNLLLELDSSVQMSGDTVSSAAELELNLVIPESFLPKKREILRPNTTCENIKIHHWIKIVIRLSRPDPNPEPDAEPGKKKHFEISIESPIHLLDSRCTNSNVYVPAYIDPVSRRPSSASIRSMRPIPTAEVHENRLIHFLRKPSIAPPTFDADVAPPALSRAPSREAPPGYETVMQNETSTYDERFATYQKQRQQHEDENNAEHEQVDFPPPPRPQTVLETLHLHNDVSSTTRRDSSSASLNTASTESTTSTHEGTTAASSIGSPVLNSRVFDNPSDSSTPEPPQQQQPQPPTTEGTPAETAATTGVAEDQGRDRFQSTTSVDIVDQTSYDPDDPLANHLRPVSSRASSVFPSTSPSVTLEDLLPKMTLASDPWYERAPLLGHHYNNGGNGSNGGIGSSHRVSEVGMVPPPTHGANTARGRLDSAADIGVRGNSMQDDDQVSLASTPSLWIS